MSLTPWYCYYYRDITSHTVYIQAALALILINPTVRQYDWSEKDMPDLNVNYPGCPRCLVREKHARLKNELSGPIKRLENSVRYNISHHAFGRNACSLKFSLARIKSVHSCCQTILS